MIFFYFSFHVALIVTFLPLAFAEHHHLDTDFLIFPYLFFAALFVYNFDRYFGSSVADRLNNPDRTLYHQLHTLWSRRIVMVSFIVIVALFFYFNRDTQVLLALLALLTGAYFLFSQVRHLGVTGLVFSLFKLLLLATVWTIVIAVIPHVSAAGFSFDFFYESKYLRLSMISVFVIIFVNGLWFDLRDRDGDAIARKNNFANCIEDRYYFLFLIALPVFSISFFPIHRFLSICLIGFYYLFLAVYSYYRELYPRYGETFYYFFVDFPLLAFSAMEVISRIFFKSGHLYSW